MMWITSVWRRLELLQVKSKRMKKKKSNSNRLLLAVGVGVGAYVVLKLIQGRTSQPQYNLPVQQYPNTQVPQQKGKGLQTVVDVVGVAANLANTLFGKGGPFSKK